MEMEVQPASINEDVRTKKPDRNPLTFTSAPMLILFSVIIPLA
jgi:hypothetical protein